MATVLVLLVVVPVAVVTGTVLAGVASSARFRREGEAFRCKHRVRGARRRRLLQDPHGWPRLRTRARWVHDVLVVRRGFLVPRVETYAVRAPEDAVRRTGPGDVGGLGVEALCLFLRLDDGRTLELAAPSADRTLLVGPFLAAAMRELPDGPAEQRPRG